MLEVGSIILGRDDLPFPIAVVSTGLGMVVAGAAIARAGRWTGWGRWAPLMMGIYPFVAIVPWFAATGERPPTCWSLAGGWPSPQSASPCVAPAGGPGRQRSAAGAARPSWWAGDHTRSKPCSEVPGAGFEPARPRGAGGV